MKNAMLSPTRRSVYPGSFIPMLDELEVKKKFKKSAILINALYSPVKTGESQDAVNIEMSIPGIKRDDLFIYCDDKMLTICVMQANKGAVNYTPQAEMDLTMNGNFFYRTIELPENADPEFISAEYREDKLYLFISKTYHPIKKRHTRIAVY